MSNVAIRPYKPADIKALLPLLSQLGYPTSQDKLIARLERFSSESGQSNGHGVAVADLDGQVIGCVAWTTASLFVLDKVRFHIEGLAVDDRHRRLGIGKALLAFVEEVASQCGQPAIIDLTSGTRRAKDGSHKFYISLGYKNDGPMAKLYFRKEIG